MEGTKATKKIEWDYGNDLVSVWYDAGRIDPGQLASEIRKLGYNVEIVKPSKMGGPTEARLVKVPVPGNAPAFFVAALEAANKANRPVLIDFSAPWCAPCVRLKKETLENREVAKALEDVQVIHVDLDEYPDLARPYGVATIPDILFVDPKGFVIDRLQGFEEPTAFLSRLKRLTSDTPEELADLSEDGRELKEAFNSEKEKARLILFVSPG